MQLPSMSSARFMGASILLLLGVARAAAAVNVPQCPGELRTVAAQVSPAQGWSGIAPPRLLLSGAGVVLDSPNDKPRAELRGDYRRLSRYVAETAYPDIDSREKWLVCAYGQGGEFEQAHRLPADAGRCVIRTTKDQYNHIEVLVSCAAKP